MRKRTRNRWPKGTWMELRSPDMLRLWLKERDASHRWLADASGVSHGFISHLTAGRKKSCTPAVAERIAFSLGVPMESLFKPSLPTSASQSANQNRRAA